MPPGIYQVTDNNNTLDETAQVKASIGFITLKSELQTIKILKN